MSTVRGPRLTWADRAFIRRHRSRHGRLGGVRVTRMTFPPPTPTVLLVECVCGKGRRR